MDSVLPIEWVTLGQIFKTFLGFGFLMCKVALMAFRGRSHVVSVELRLAGLMSSLLSLRRGGDGVSVVVGRRTEGRQGVGVLSACPGVWWVGLSELGPEGCIGVCLGGVSVCTFRPVC